jgi:hypothetical protein
MMARITADVYSQYEGAAYRLYVNDTLMTERTFAWPPTKNFVREHIIIDGQQGSSYTITAMSLTVGNSFTVKNVKVDDKNTESTFTL